MKNMKKFIAGLSALAMILTSFASVSAKTVLNGHQYDDLFNSYGDETASTTGEPHYVLNGTDNTTIFADKDNLCKFYASTINSKVEIRQGKFCTSGTRSMTLRPADTGSQDNNHAGAVLVKFILPQVADGEYHVRFNAFVDDLVWDYKNYAYATINWHMLSEGSSGKASLLYSKDNSDGLWTVTNIGTGASNGGIGSHTWYRFESTITATNAENELRFSSKGWEAFTIDDIVVTDKNGNVVLSEDFEVATGTTVNGNTYNEMFKGYGDGTSSTTGEPHYVLNGTNNKTIYGGNTSRFYASTVSSKVEIRQGKFCTNGYRSMTLRPANTGSQDSNHAGAVLVKFILPKVVDNEYHVRFNAYVDDLVYDYKNYAYATMNWNMLSEGSSGKASLLYSKDNSDGLWTVTTLGTGAEVGGLGTTQTWRRYEATINASNDENELRFSTKGWDAFTIDEIVVTDKNGVVVFSEDFEYGYPEVEAEDGEDVLETYKDGWEFSGDEKRNFYIVEYPASSGNHQLRIYGRNGNTGSGNVGWYKISLPKRAADGEYHITYDVVLQEGKTKTAASLDVTGTSIYSTDHQLTNTGGEHVVTGSGDYLWFAAEGWANAYVDNIVVKDKNDNVLFTEDFENFDEKYSYYAYSTKLQGLSANGIDDTIYLSWRNPKRDDISAIKIIENGEETMESQIYEMSTLSEEVNIVPMSAGFIGAGTVHEYDVQFITNDNYCYHNYISAKEGERFLAKTKTKDGLPLQGWNLSATDGATVNGLGSVYYDTLNKAEGSASLHINPNITRVSSDQIYDSNKTHVIASYDENETRAHFYLEALAYGITETGDYKLSFKQKGHYAPSYHVYYVGDSVNSIGAFTGQYGYTNNAAWQTRELQFNIGSIPSGGMPVIRFDFSNGCDDFWLDDVKLVKVGGNGTNLIANGNFEYGLSNLAKSGNRITWTLADANDSVNVYKKAGDSLILVDTLAKGATSYTPTVEGTKETLVFRTVKKSGTSEFLSDPFEIALTQDSYVYDAKFELVDSNYEVIGVPESLVGDALLKTSVKIENTTDALKGADLYTIIYKNGILLNVDKQTVSTGKGEITASSIMSVPDISDGVYAAKVFVWNMGTFEPLKQAKTLDE